MADPQHDNHDQHFMINFGKVMAGLGVIFAICITAASLISGADVRDDAAAIQQVADRLEPIGTVVTDPSKLIQVAAVQREPLTGAQVVDRVCAGCHALGVLNAPKTGDTAVWRTRLGQGLDVLVQHSIDGIRSMPPRGGDGSLSDDEVRDSVKELLKQSGITL